MQKEKLLATLDLCRENKIKKLEIIHGIGDGVIKRMIRNVLENQAHLGFYNTVVIEEDFGAVIVLF